MFRSVPFQPEAQFLLQDHKNERISLGIYDTKGFTDMEYLKYILNGQKETKSTYGLIDSAILTPKTKGVDNFKQKRKMIVSDAFMIVFDVGSKETFEAVFFLQFRSLNSGVRLCGRDFQLFRVFGERGP